MKLVSRLVIAFAICLMAIPILAVTTPVQAAEPTISLSYSWGYVGDEIYVTGSDFTDYASDRLYIRYKVNSGYETVKRVWVESDGTFTSDEFEIPESCKGEHYIGIDTDAGGIPPWRETFTVKPKLKITEPDDAEGPVGTEVTIKGTGFGEDEEDIEIRYYLDGSDYETVKEDIDADEYGGWEVTFTIPASSRGDHKIDAKGDDSGLYEVEDAGFEVKPGISLSKLSGYVGDTVAVKGSGFKDEESGIKVTYDGTQAGSSTTANDDGSWEVSFEVPPSTKGDHKVDAYGRYTSATSISDKYFTVKPKITLTPDEGHVGTSLSVSGSGFSANREVSIKYEATQVATATSDNKGSFSTTFLAPKGPYGEHMVTVTDARGNKASANFTTVRPKVTLAPSEGYVGISVTISGSGFASNQVVTIKYDETQVAIATSGSKGDLTATFLAPESMHGNHTITAADASGNSVSVTFVMESNPPDKPPLSLPGNGSRVGFIGSQTTTFQWVTVIDPSGVSYKLQIASDPGFVSLVVPEISGLIETSYTLPKEQALSYGTYYWRVKAIDGAQNDSGWTAGYSFQSGFLPTWAFIVIIIIIVVLIAALVYLLGIKRR